MVPVIGCSPRAEPCFVSTFRQHCTANLAMPSSAHQGIVFAPIASCCANESTVIDCAQGRIFTIDLTTGTQSDVLTGLHCPAGLARDGAGTLFYVESDILNMFTGGGPPVPAIISSFASGAMAPVQLQA